MICVSAVRDSTLQFSDTEHRKPMKLEDWDRFSGIKLKVDIWTQIESNKLDLLW